MQAPCAAPARDTLVTVALAASCTLLPPAAGQDVPSLRLVSFTERFALETVPQRDAQIAVTESGALRLETGNTHPWPGIDLKAPDTRWNLSGYLHVAIDVKNVGATAGILCLRVDNPGADGREHCLTDRIRLQPAEAGTIEIDLTHSPYKSDAPQFIGMRGTPIPEAKLDPSNVVNLVVFSPRPREKLAFEVTNVRAAGKYVAPNAPPNAKEFFPMIDEFGQYMHKDWPGKTYSIEDMRKRILQEAADLAAHTGPSDWDAYGGWASGPKVDATGFFRAQKHEGKWWLVDPDGRLFWSNGIDGVREHSATPITDREHYFAFLPEEGTPFAQFYGKGNWAPRGYYQGKGTYRMYDFTRANLLRKYGENWLERFADITQRRLRSWGINTIANWSSEAIYLKRQTPYVVAIHYRSPDLRGSTGLWKKFSDVFDPGFRAGVAARLAHETGKSAGDPWCIGYFVDNELGWGDDTSLGLATLACPPEQAAKKAFLADLEAKYRTIDKLNAAWGTNHDSWEVLLEATQTPDADKAAADLRDFYTRTAETYFRTIREEVKRVAPNQLYLGCRFSNHNDRAVRAAAKFCDIISFNRYRYSVDEDRLPDGVDMPMIIGEFHFGALDRGMLHTGLRKAENQEHRAQLYADYVRGALKNPWYVGAHWFIYKDQATTGRGDGENYQIGFIDGCDTPYPEIIAKSRDVARELYQLRTDAK